MNPIRQTAASVDSQLLMDSANAITRTGVAIDAKHVQEFRALGILLSSARRAGVGRPSARNLSVATKGSCLTISPPVIELTRSSWLWVVAM